MKILTNNSIKNITELTDVFCNMMTTLTESLIKLRKSFILSITFVHIAWIYFHIGVFPPLILLHIRTIPLFWNSQICILYSNITMYYTKSLLSILCFVLVKKLETSLSSEHLQWPSWLEQHFTQKSIRIQIKITFFDSKKIIYTIHHVDEKIKTLDFSRVKKENFSGTTFWVASCNFKVIY